MLCCAAFLVIDSRVVVVDTLNLTCRLDQHNQKKRRKQKPNTTTNDQSQYFTGNTYVRTSFGLMECDHDDDDDDDFRLDE